MEKNYGMFKLKLGNLADFAGDAIVVPCFSDLTAGCRISDSLINRIRETGK